MQAQVWWVLMVPGISSLPEQNGTEKKNGEQVWTKQSQGSDWVFLVI